MSRRGADEDWLEAYLDNLLSPQEAEEFERRLSEDPALREQLMLSREIDASLVRAFAHTDGEAESIEVVRQAAAKKTHAGTDARSQRFKLIVAAAAAVVACVLAGRQFLQTGIFDQPPPYRLENLEQIYNHSVTTGFKPKWLCEDDREFVETFENRQGQGLLLANVPSNMRMAGLAYLGGLSPNTTTLMMWVDNKPVMVFVERLDRDEKMDAPPENSGLHLFRREKLGLVFYEISPFARPRVIDLMVPADSADLPATDDSSANRT